MLHVPYLVCIIAYTERLKEDEHHYKSKQPRPISKGSVRENECRVFTKSRMLSPPSVLVTESTIIMSACSCAAIGQPLQLKTIMEGSEFCYMKEVSVMLNERGRFNI